MNYEVGKWYWYKDPEIFAIVRYEAHATYYLSFSESYTSSGEKLGFDNCGHDSIQGLATPAKIDQCLKAYAEKNGYVEGVKIKDPAIKDYPYILYPMSYYDGDGSLSDDNGTLIYKEMKTGEGFYIDHQWAELVKEEPKSTVTAGFFDTEEYLDHEMVKFVESCSGMPTYHTIKETKLEVRGEMVSIQELIDAYQKYLDIKSIIG